MQRYTNLTLTCNDGWKILKVFFIITFAFVSAGNVVGTEKHCYPQHLTLECLDVVNGKKSLNNLLSLPS